MADCKHVRNVFKPNVCKKCGESLPPLKLIVGQGKGIVLGDRDR